ncbi:MAG TPA: hypothetical protein VK106_00800, partial [Balneolaceae bacterium]|nr:hypothetical protein [Balneolaceae bacterium]
MIFIELIVSFHRIVIKLNFRMKKILFTLFFAAMLPFTLFGQKQPKAFKGAKILPITSEPIENGILIVQDGTIRAIGSIGEVEIPSNAKVYDLSDKIIMPGLIDSHAHIGGAAGGDRSAA